ncbi:MAG: PQQ-binding-like beta-propeller repeat protein [Anaerolineales bacterium]
MASRADMSRVAPAYRPTVNWPLWIGLALAGAILLIAVIGPRLAPRDPLKESYTVFVENEFVHTPFPPFTVPGYPLGSDEFGRDTLSRLLWAVRPTLVLVLVAAATRLVLGLALGMVAGWGEGWARRWADAAIAGALALPTLFVALAVIAAAGRQFGVWAFIVGLTITGWAETARIMRNQTASLKNQPFVEAARAVGATKWGILYRHILTHLLPLGWILLAFEVSYTLLTTAALGFMGYFTNSVWIELDDGVALLTSGLPELGQMLAGATRSQHTPWVLALSGTAVFVSVLGFSLLGEGMRTQLNPQLSSRRRNTWWSKMSQALDDWMVDRWPGLAAAWRRSGSAVLAGITALVILAGGGLFLWQMQKGSVVATARLIVPGGHLWASARHDAFGTRWAEADGPRDPVQLWHVENPDGFTGGPAIDSDGLLYLGTVAGDVLALNADGVEQWRVRLSDPVFGAPALGAQGDIYVAGAGGGLTALDPSGHVLWTLPTGGSATLDGPLVSSAGVIYFASQAQITAVHESGAMIWRVGLPTFSWLLPVLKLSPDEQFLFFEDSALDAATGTVVYEPTSDPFDGFVVGADGRVFLRNASQWLEWRATETGAVLESWTRVDDRSLELGGTPGDAGGTPDGFVWTGFNGFRGSFPTIAWLDAQGQVVGTSSVPYASGHVVAVDRGARLYACGLAVQDTRVGGFLLDSVRGHAQCRAIEPRSSQPTWIYDFENTSPVLGGALVQNRLYVVTAHGVLYAIGDLPAP